MTKLTKVEELLKKGETHYSNRVHVDIYGKGVIAGFHSRDDEVVDLKSKLETARTALEYIDYMDDATPAIREICKLNLHKTKDGEHLK